MGLKSDLFKVIGFVNKKFCTVATLKNKSDGFVWHLVAIYGTSYNELKLEFFAELHEVMDGLTYPVLLGGF